MKILIILVSCFLFQNILFALEQVRISAPRSSFDFGYIYHYKLLQKVLDITQKEYGKLEIASNNAYEQSRSLIKLKKNEDIDLVWTGTSIKREEELSAIKIPLSKGLLGYRIFIINKKNIKLFDSINNFEDLKKLKACQGRYWPDTKILESSGLEVIKNTNYESLFIQIQKGRCDYFPRSVSEAFIEIQSRKDKYKDLMVYKKIILYYAFPMYFFVNKNNKTLKQRLEKGLLMMIENGSFFDHMKTSQNTKDLFPLKKWMNVKIFYLRNPYLPYDTNIKDRKLWILPK